MKDSSKETAKGLIHEFKEFISRGNVVDMAVGLIVGSAFTAIVKSLVDDIFSPIIGMIIGGIDFTKLGVTIPWGTHPYIGFGNFIQSCITFLLTALCVFIIIKFMNAFRKKKDDEKKEEVPQPTKEELLLTEIRDLLKEGNNAKAIDLAKSKSQDENK